MRKLLCLLVLCPILAFAHYNPGDQVVLKCIPGCGACAEAKAELRQNHIPFTVDMSGGFGFYPQLYVNGKYKGTGAGAVDRWIND